MSDNDVLKELRTITRVLLFANSTPVEKELEKIASTDERKKIWVLIDGRRLPKDIANDGKVGERTVNYFLSAASAARIVEYSKGKPPVRTLDYVPPSWIELLQLQDQDNGTKGGQSQTTIEVG